MNLWLRDGLGGLTQTLARVDLLPYFLWDWDRPWEDATLIVLPSPTRVLDDPEQQRLLDYVERGGHLLIATGWEQVAPLQPFLDRLGPQVRNAPLGQTSGTSWTGHPVRFAYAWPVTVEPRVANSSEVLAWAGDAPGIVRCRRGSGSVTLIGDARFLRNEHIEGRSRHVPENIAFLRAFVQEKVAPGRSPTTVAASGGARR